MTDRFNTIAGWTLFAGIVALGLSIGSGMYFQADKPHPPHTPGYMPAGVVVDGPADEGPALATLLASGDAAAGGADFASRCTVCHTIDQGGATGTGPNLFAIVGKPVGGHEAGFAYSSALADHGGDWSYENLDAWLANPKGFAAGTKMTFAGLSNAQGRANLILFLRDNGGGPALPAPPAAEPAEAEAAADAAATPEPAAAGGE